MATGPLRAAVTEALREMYAEHGMNLLGSYVGVTPA
jgi:hypothetical protein